MAQRPPKQAAAPAEILAQLSGGYNGFVDPTLTTPKAWFQAVNVFASEDGFIHRCRFANIINNTGYGLSPYGLGPYGGGATNQPYTTLKYFALPGLSAYLLGDIANKMYSFDTGLAYAKTQRINPYVDPAGTGNATLVGPWSRATLQNIVYEMNGLVKQSGRNANAATIEGFGIDAPDASPQVTILAAGSTNIDTVVNSGVVRLNGIVTVKLTGAISVVVGQLINISGVTDTSFNGTFTVNTIISGSSFTYLQFGQNVTSGLGTANGSITKAVGRSYSWAWENANKPHVSAPSPSTQFIQYTNQSGIINLIEPGTVTTNGTTTVTGVGTFFTSAWIGRSLWIVTLGSVGRIVAVPSTTQLTLATAATAAATQQFQIFDPQSTHVRLYQTADSGATYFRVQRNLFVSSATTLVLAGLQFGDFGNSEPPNFPFTTETSQLNNIPPPIGSFIYEYQGRLLVFGVAGANQSFFYSNSETTNIGMPQESFAPLNQVTLPIQNASLKGMLEFPGQLILWSDKQDMFRMTGLLTDNSVLNVAATQTGAQQGASISSLPYNLGIANPYAQDITPLGGIWLTPNAEVWLFTGTYAPKNIGRPVQDILNSIPKANLSLARAKHFHTNNRNWWALAIPQGSGFNNTVLILDLDLLASNGTPSYFTFDMAENQPTWYVFNPGPVSGGIINPRCDSIEAVYEAGGAVRLLTGGVDLIQDVDYQSFLFGAEIQVPSANVGLHAWGNDSAFDIKRPGFFRFNTNQDPATLGPDGWTFQVQGIDDDFYTFQSPLLLNLVPGINDVATLCGNPSLTAGQSFRYSPALFKVGAVNFVMGRRLRFVVNFPPLIGNNYALSNIQIGFGASPPR
jgi:hypothetical protein